VTFNDYLLYKRTHRRV